jgi:hypothetical protein
LAVNVSTPITTWVRANSGTALLQVIGRQVRHPGMERTDLVPGGVPPLEVSWRVFDTGSQPAVLAGGFTLQGRHLGPAGWWRCGRAVAPIQGRGAAWTASLVLIGAGSVAPPMIMAITAARGQHCQRCGLPRRAHLTSSLGPGDEADDDRVQGEHGGGSTEAATGGTEANDADGHLSRTRRPSKTAAESRGRRSLWQSR